MHTATTTGHDTTQTNAHITARELITRATALRQTLHALHHNDIAADDTRLITLWSRSGDTADDTDMCEVYDEIVEAVGGQTRQHEYEVTIDVVLSTVVTVTTTTTARDSSSALDDTQDRYDTYDIRTLVDSQINLDYEYEITDWDAEDAERI